MTPLEAIELRTAFLEREEALIKLQKQIVELKQECKIAYKVGLERAAEICDPFKFKNACDRVLARELREEIREEMNK